MLMKRLGDNDLQVKVVVEEIDIQGFGNQSCERMLGGGGSGGDAEGLIFSAQQMSKDCRGASTPTDRMVQGERFCRPETLRLDLVSPDGVERCADCNFCFIWLQIWMRRGRISCRLFPSPFLSSSNRMPRKYSPTSNSTRSRTLLCCSTSFIRLASCCRWFKWMRNLLIVCKSSELGASNVEVQV